MTDKPSMIACRTIIGFGAPNKQGSHDVHGAPLGDEEIAAARVALDWPHEPFTVPDEVYAAWHAVAARGRDARLDWEKRLAGHDKQDAFETAQAKPDANALNAAITAYKAQLSEEKPKVATRKASQMALEIVNGTLPNTVGGSADLTGSNLTKTGGMTDVTAKDFSGNYVHYGVREHGMAAIMNGLALHGGFVPYGGTFLQFADYARAAIRLSALMGVRVVYVMTHDCIGLGEDGPTHQPVEVLASFRAMPNLNVFRPADAVETAEAWQAAIEIGDHAEHPVAVAPGPAGAAHDAHGREPLRQGRLCAARRRRHPRRDPDRHRLGGRDRDGGRRQTGGGEHPRRRRLDALLRSLRRPAGRLPRGGAWAPRRGLASRPPCRWAGRPFWAAMVPLSACPASAPRRRRTSSTSTSASRRTPSRMPPRN